MDRTRALKFVVALALALGLLTVGVVVLSRRTPLSEAPVEPPARAGATPGPEAPSPQVSGGSARRTGPGDAARDATPEPGHATVRSSLVEESPQASPLAVLGRVLDTQGQPLAQAAVQFVQAGSSEDEAAEPLDPAARAASPTGAPEATAEGTAERVLSTTTTDEEGRFTLRVEPTARGHVRARADRYLEQRAEWVAPKSTAREPGPPPTPGAEAPDDVDQEPVSEDAPPEPEVVLMLPRESAVGGTITVPGQPEGDAGPRLVAVQRFTDPTSWHQPRIIELAAEDTDFYLPVPPGRYHVWAYARGAVRSALRTAQPEVDRPVTDLAFELGAGCRLEAIAIDGRTGLPVAQAIVYAPRSYLPGTIDTLRRQQVDGRFAHAGRTGADGRVQLADLPPGPLSIRFLHPDYTPLDLSVTLDSAQVVQVEATLSEGPGIRGEVLDEMGAPLTGASIIAVSMGDSFDRDLAQYGHAEVGEDGHYHVRNVNPGAYVVIRQPPPQQALAPRMEFTQVPARGEAVVDFIELAELATVRGQVTDAAGRPLGRAHLTFIQGGNDEDVAFKTTQADNEGRFELRNLALGRYEVGVARNPGGNFAIADRFTLAAPIDHERDLVLPDWTLTGRVTGAADQPVAGAELLVILQPDDPQAGAEAWYFAGRAESDAGGRYRIEGLASGRYLLMGSAPGYRQTSRSDLDLRAGLPSATADLQLEPGASVEVTVLDEQGRAIDGARVVIQDAAGETVNLGLPPLTQAGRYRFRSLAPGLHRVVVTYGEGPPAVGGFEATLETQAAITIVVTPAS